MQGAQSYSTVSFEEPIGENRTALELLGEEDEEYLTAERRVLLAGGMRAPAPSASRRSCGCASSTGLTQREIAERVGISQMHVSRLIRRSLEDMRARMADPDEQPRETKRRALRAA